MITEHARIARSLGEQLELPVTVLDGLGAAYEQWDGKGWPGERSGRRGAAAGTDRELAEFTEVAHRIGGLAAVATSSGVAPAASSIRRWPSWSTAMRSRSTRASTAPAPGVR